MAGVPSVICGCGTCRAARWLEFPTYLKAAIGTEPSKAIFFFMSHELT